MQFLRDEIKEIQFKISELKSELDSSFEYMHPTSDLVEELGFYCRMHEYLVERYNNHYGHAA